MARTEGQKKSRKQEDRLAGRLGGSRNAASGALWLRKGDVRNEAWLVEAKWTGKQQFTLKASVLEEAMTEALISGRRGVVAISLNGKNYMVLDEDDFLELCERAQEEIEGQGP